MAPRLPQLSFFFLGGHLAPDYHLLSFRKLPGHGHQAVPNPFPDSPLVLCLTTSFPSPWGMLLELAFLLRFMYLVYV